MSPSQLADLKSGFYSHRAGRRDIDEIVPAFPFTAILLEMMERAPAGLRWAVTCGSALALHGLESEPNDLDFFGPVAEVERLEKNLTELEVVFPLAWRATEPFHSYFGRFRVRGVEVDVVGDFSVRMQGTCLVWDAGHPCWRHLARVALAGKNVPVFSLEDLLVMYLVIPDETHKLELLRAALRARGIDRAYLETLFAHWPQMAGPVRGWLGC